MCDVEIYFFCSEREITRTYSCNQVPGDPTTQEWPETARALVLVALCKQLCHLYNQPTFLEFTGKTPARNLMFVIIANIFYGACFKSLVRWTICDKSFSLSFVNILNFM